MPITDKQAAAREQERNRFGSSEVPTLLGINPFESRYDLWAIKTGRVEQEDISQKPSVKAGKLFERGVLLYAQEELGPLMRNQYRTANGLPLFAHVDAIVRSSGLPVEAKTAGLGGYAPEGWGEPGTDDIPDHVTAQAHAHMICTDTDTCFIPVFLVRRGFLMFQVPRNPDLVQVIIDRAAEFADMIQRDIPPTDEGPSLDIAKRMRRVPRKVVPVPVELIERHYKARAFLKAAEAAEDEARSALMAALGDAEATAPTQAGAYTYYSQSGRYLDQKKLKEEHPEIIQQYTRETSFPVLRFKKPK